MGSFGLPALHVNPPGDPVEGIKTAVALKGMMQQQAGQQQEQQIRGIQIQKAQQQQKDQQTYQQALASTNGDPESALKLIAGKVNPQSYDTFLKAHTDTQKELAEKNSKEFDLLQKKHTAMADLYQQAQNLPDDQYAQAWPQIAQRANQLEPTMKLDPAQPIPKQMLARFGIGLSVSENYLKTEQERRNAQKAPLEMQKLEAETSKAQAEADNMKKFGGSGVEAQQQADWIAKNPGKGPSDYAIAMKKLVPQFNFALQNTGTTGAAVDVAKRFGMSAPAFDQAAEKYWTSGQLPPSGRGGPSLALNKAIMNRVAELHPEGSLAANSAEFKANQESLKKLQSNLDAVSAFESTANKNIDLLLEQGKKIVDSGSPWINKPLRMLDANAVGDANVPAFNAARQTAINEIAKVTSSPGLTGQLSDTARKEVESFIPASATFAQTMRVAEVLKKDMANRHESYQQQIDDIKGRIKGGSSGGKEIHYKIVNGQLVPQ